MDELPWAIFANGPAWTSAGCPSSVCIKVGMIASRSNTVTAPAMPRASRFTGSPFLSRPTTALPTRSRISARLVVSAKMAINSLATVISNPVERGKTGLGEPSLSLSSLNPTLIWRSVRSQTSTTRFQVIVSGSISIRVTPRLSNASSDCRLS